ncbi:MAG: sulfatase-like hydrolase/transferase, partial [Planctomycetota bacterium]
DVFFAAALDWIDEQRQQPGPFFAYISTNAPHDPMIAPQAYKQPFLDAGFDEHTAARYGMIANIDHNMGVLRDRLKAWDLDPNTLLIFMTDNGQAVSHGKRDGETYPLHVAGLRARKGSVHEGGTRVPCFWHWKETLSEGQDVDALTAHIDLYRTLAELAGGDVPEEQVEGRSLIGLLDDPEASWPERLLFVHRGRWPKGANPDDHQYEGCAVRSPKYRLIDHQQLFDIQTDPGETTNVAAEHPEEVARLQKAFDQWWPEARSRMVNEDVPNASEAPFWVDYQHQLETEGIPTWTPR